MLRPLDGDADGTATCDIGAFEQVAFVVDGTLVGTALQLTWNESGDSGYEIWRGTTPYGSLEYRASTDMPAYVELEAGAADTDLNYYFQVQGTDFGGDSNRIAVFAFALLPGD